MYYSLVKTLYNGSVNSNPDHFPLPQHLSGICPFLFRQLQMPDGGDTYKSPMIRTVCKYPTPWDKTKISLSCKQAKIPSKTINDCNSIKLHNIINNRSFNSPLWPGGGGKSSGLAWLSHKVQQNKLLQLLKIVCRVFSLLEHLLSIVFIINIWNYRWQYYLI